MTNDEAQPADATEISDEELDAVAGGYDKNNPPKKGKKGKK
ncbi:MAG TPA: hypothetical protein VNR37_04040 [Microbacteriaceae bacterium]|nr:hypothetical protein [Microbacteriaceae bacterium]HWL01311.1 hypothetical protein [Microbacteriaceae bacterium]